MDAEVGRVQRLLADTQDRLDRHSQEHKHQLDALRVDLQQRMTDLAQAQQDVIQATGSSVKAQAKAAELEAQVTSLQVSLAAHLTRTITLEEERDSANATRLAEAQRLAVLRSQFDVLASREADLGVAVERLERTKRDAEAGLLAKATALVNASSEAQMLRTQVASQLLLIDQDNRNLARLTERAEMAESALREAQGRLTGAETALEAAAQVCRSSRYSPVVAR